jgi:hypothetical protein
MDSESRRRYLLAVVCLFVLQAYDPALFELHGEVFADHHVPMDVYHAKNIPQRRPGGAAAKP